MENASKALLIAGAILICILIIAIGMYIYNSAQGTIQTAASQMGNQEKEIYNTTVKKYLGDHVKGSDVKGMLEDIITQNNQYVGESGKFISVNIEGTFDGYNGGTTLATACSAANVYENAGSDNTQPLVDAATTQIRELKKKIGSNRVYKVEERMTDGIIYKVIITQVSTTVSGGGGATPATT